MKSKKQSIFWKIDDEKQLAFIEKYIDNNIRSKGYTKWHYVNGFTKFSSNKKEKKKNEKLMNELNNKIYTFLNDAFSNISFKISNDSRIQLSEKPTIFFCWWQGKEKLPKLQKLCYKRLCKLCKDDYNIIFISEKNVSDYIQLPDFIINAMLNKDIYFQTFIDYVKILLLEKYEGIWMDATVFIKEMPNINDFNYPFWSVKSENIFVNTWVENIMPTFIQSQMYLLAGTSSIFYQYLEQLTNYYIKTYKIAFSYFLIYYFADYLYQNIDEVKKMYDILPENNKDVEKLTTNIKSKDEITTFYKELNTKFFKLLKYQSKNDILYNIYKYLKKVNRKNLK